MVTAGVRQVPEFQLDRSSPTELDRWVAPAMGAGCSEPVLLSTYSDGFVDTNSNDCCHHDNGDAAYSDESSSQDSGLGMDQVGELFSRMNSG